MSKFKVGDRVRIVNCPDSPRNGAEGIIYKKASANWLSLYPHYRGREAWQVDVDGWGKRDSIVLFTYCHDKLIPLIPPDELAWQKFRNHLQPNPAIIFDADPIIVSTDEEAERIADTVPNSHIKVVIRGVLVSEYYGRSTTNQPEGSQ